MPRVLIVTEPPVAPETFRLALPGIGYNAVDEIDDAQRLVKRAIAIEPDVIIAGTESSSKNLFAAASALDEHAPYPLLIFTPDADLEKIEPATAGGVHSYIVDGFSARRDTNGRETLTVVRETSSARDDAGILTAYRELLKRKLGIETLVELAAPGELKSLTGIDSRQKPVRLIDESKK